VDLKGFEPLTSSMPWKRAPNCATGPRMRRLRHENIIAAYRKYRAILKNQSTSKIYFAKVLTRFRINGTIKRSESTS
jgi:hypothetical protein